MKSPHGDFAKYAMEFGFPHAVAVLGVLMYLGFSRRRKDLQSAMGTNTNLQFAIASVSFFVLSGGLVSQRVFYVLWGCIIAWMFLGATKQPNPSQGSEPARRGGIERGRAP